MCVCTLCNLCFVYKKGSMSEPPHESLFDTFVAIYQLRRQVWAFTQEPF